MSIIFFICGDMNIRIGKMDDCINNVDNIPKRSILDTVHNVHGQCLIDFLFEAKFCAVNGRISPEYDDITNVSSKGKSVVDYILIPHSSLSVCREFNVIRCVDFVNVNKLKAFVGQYSKLPDHSILSLSIDLPLSNTVYI